MAVASASSSQEPPLLAPRLRDVRVGLREDLDVSRHLFHGIPSYIVRDPVTFQSQRLDLADYEVFVSIDTTRSLSETFDDLVHRGKIAAEDEERFYQFIMGLHRLGFLQLPVSDHKLLYKRHQMKQRARRNEKLMGFLFLRIPLVNPNAFLDATIRHVRPLFSRGAFLAWVVLVLCAAFVAARQWDQLAQPLEGLLVTRNLVLMWFTLIILKVFHELGHAYACKHFGGHVPEMGAYLIVFTPCAYMDATASWGFASKRDRIIVCLAGMYVESIFAALAVFVWAMTGQSLLHSLAYNVMFLAGIVTVLFNINPLMRYDGYYILGDLLEVPNLRARATRYVLAVFKRVLLGIPIADRPDTRRLRCILLIFGIAAGAYRITLVLAIAAILASKLFVVGVALALVYLGTTAFSMLRRLTSYLFRAEETAPVRRRAIALGVLAMVVTPAALMLVPVPSNVYAAAMLTPENETVVRAKTPGFLRDVPVECGRVVDQGRKLAVLANDAYLEDVAVAEANIKASSIRRDAFRMHEPDRARQEADRAAAYQSALDRGRERIAGLVILSPERGRLINCLDSNDIGLYLHEGDAVASVVSGRWRARVLLTGDDFAGARPRVGDEVEFRSAAAPGRTIDGVVVKVAPAGGRVIGVRPLTHLGGGDIAVNPATAEATQPYFEILVELHADGDTSFRYGMTGTVRLHSQAEPLLKSVFRRLTRFINVLVRD